MFGRPPTPQIIESLYVPRPTALNFHARTQRFAILVFHRRAGKTVMCINDVIERAMQNPLPYPRYAYIAPFYSQAKTVAWQYLKHYTTPVCDRIMESELSVRLMGNGASIRLFGADNPDSLRGIYLDGVVLDEYAQMSSKLFGEVIAPTLADRGGFAVFIGTPQGENAFYDLWKDAQADPRWYCEMLKASESGIIPDEELQLMRSLPGVDEDSYRQEFECDFTAAIKGSYYGKQINALTYDHFGEHPYDPDRPVHLAFDIGFTDQTSIWFFQTDGKNFRMVDFFNESGYSVAELLLTLRQPPYHQYAYGTFYLPHDARNKSFQTGKSVRELMVAGGAACSVLPNLSILDGIAAGRATLPNVYFNTINKRVGEGLNSLRLYKADFDSKRGVLRATPLHDQHSHPADAYRSFAMAMNPAAAKRGGRSLPRFVSDHNAAANRPNAATNVLSLEALFKERERAKNNGYKRI